MHKLLTRQWPDMELHAYVLAVLCAAGQEEAVLESLVGFTSGRRVSQIVSFTKALDRQGLTSCAQAVIREVDTRECFKHLVRRLSQADLRSYAVLALNTHPGLGPAPRRYPSQGQAKHYWLPEAGRPSITEPDPDC